MMGGGFGLGAGPGFCSVAVLGASALGATHVEALGLQLVASR